MDIPIKHEEKLRFLSEMWVRLGFIVIGSSIFMKLRWQEILNHRTKEVTLAVVSCSNPEAIFDAIMRLHDVEFSTFRAELNTKVRETKTCEKGPGFDQIETLIESIRQHEPGFSAELVVVSIPRPDSPKAALPPAPEEPRPSPVEEFRLSDDDLLMLRGHGHYVDRKLRSANT